jgi:hypothetical protein
MESTTVSDRDGQAGADPAPGAPAQGQSWWRGSVSARRVGQAALALIAVQTLFRGWAVFTGFFYEDDFRYVYDASTSALSGTFLLQDYNGHLMPGQFLLVWLLQELAPMSFTAVAVVLLVLQVAAALTVWLLLRELVGPRLGALVPLAVYLFSPLTLGSFLWYAASIQAVPLQLTLAGCLLFHVRFLRRGSRRDAVVALAVFLAGLVFWEKALLVVPVLAAVTVLWFSTGGPVRRVVDAVTRHWQVWLAYLVLSAGYLAIYVSRVAWQLKGGGDPGSTLDLAREAVLNGFVPALFGGPFTGFPTGLALAPNPPTSVQLVFLQVLGLVVAVTVVAYRGAWRAWALLGGYLLVDVLLLASGRIDVLGPVIGRDTRYIADVSVVAAVAIALALFPVDGSTAAAPRRFDLARALDRPVVAGIVLLVYVNSCWITSMEMVQRWSDTSAEPYVRAAQGDLRRLGGDVVVYDRQPPPDVLSPWFLEDDRVSRIIGPLPEKPRFDRPTDDLRVVDDHGHLGPANVQVADESRPGPDQTCGWPVTGDATTTVQMQRALFSWRWVVRISYFAGTATPGRVSLGDRSYRVRFQKGLHNLYLVHTGPVDDVRIAGVTPGLTVCVPQVAIGQI